MFFKLELKIQRFGFAQFRKYVSLTSFTLHTTGANEKPKTMILKFKNKRLRINLGFGIFWIILGVFSLLTKDSVIWTDFGYLVIGILYIGLYLYEMTNQYMTIDNETIKQNGLFGKTINLKDIHRIKKLYGHYTLITKTQELKINTELIDEESKIELEHILNHLELQ